MNRSDNTSGNNINSNNIFNLEIHNRERENTSLSPLSESRHNDIRTTLRSNASSSSSENTEIDADVEAEAGNVTDPGFNNYNNYYYNHRNNNNNRTNNNNRANRNNIWNRSRCRECNYINGNNHLNTSSYRSRSIEIDRDRYQYLEMYRNDERERQEERERQRDRNMLNQIYRDLLHQNNLLQSIRIDINNIWNRIRSNDDYMRSRYQSNNSNSHIPNNTTNNRQSGTSNQRININGIPYILENIQQFNVQPRTNATSRDFINSFMNLMDFQSNVPIIPTREQIINATSEIQFGDIDNPINTTCPISLETFQDSDIVTQIVHCGHNFNTRQLNTWFHTNVRCPMCRYDIREYSMTNRSSDRSPNNESDVPLETRENMDSRENNIDSSSNLLHTERRTPRRVFSQTPPPVLETNFNNVANTLSSIAMDTINELFENNDSIFTENGDSRFLFDSSNNILLFETIVNSGNSFLNRNTSTNSNNQTRDPRNIV